MPSKRVGLMIIGFDTVQPEMRLVMALQGSFYFLMIVMRRDQRAAPISS